MNDTSTSTEAQTYSFGYRMNIIWRCVFNRCPSCSLPGISRPFAFPKACPRCGIVYDRGNGFLLSALPAVYFMFTLFWLVPLMVLFLQHKISFPLTMWLVAGGAVVIPVLLFNYCKMLALALYYFFLPRELNHPEEQDNLTN
jgi:uncharacterized protein (DUF983 family)